MADIIELDSMPLHGQVLSRLRAMLIEGRIAPGAKLNERLLCEHLHISRTPLREAIKTLAFEGLVDLVPNRGAVAVRLSAEDVQHIFEVLAGLESMAGMLATQRASDAEIAELTALHYEMLAAHLRGDLPGYFRLNAAIHLGINRAARNPVLHGIYQSTNARVQALRFSTNHDPQKWSRAINEHQQMIDALTQRDGPGLATILEAHMHHKRDMVLLMMQSGQIYPHAKGATK